MPCDCISVMRSPGYKSRLPESRHAAVCTMHKRPWCLRTRSAVSQGHEGSSECQHSQTCQGKELTSWAALRSCKQHSDAVCLQPHTLPGHRCLRVHSLTTPASPGIKYGVYTMWSGRETAALLTHLRSVWAQDLGLQPPAYSRPPCIPRLGCVWA